MNNIAIICVNYNSSSFTKSLIESIRIQNYGGDLDLFIKIYVVENSTLTHEIKTIIENYGESEDVEILVPPRNLGYFHGLNFALKKISKKQYSHIVIGNNDLIYKNNFINLLINTKYPDNSMVICPNVITKDGRHQNPHHLNKFSKFQILLFDFYFQNYLFAAILTMINGFKKKLIHSSANKIPTSITEIYQGVGACYVLLPLFFSKNTELFFPGFLYGEEACLSYQVEKSGGKLYFDPNLFVEHEESASLSRLPKIKNYEFGKDSYWKFREILNNDH